MFSHPLRRLGLALGRDLSLGVLMDRLAEIHGDRRLVTEPARGRDLTYRQAAEIVAQWSAGVAAAVEPGERVVVAFGGGYDQFLACLAVARAGALPVPVNAQMSPAEVGHVERDARAALTLRSVADLAPQATAVDPYDAPMGDLAALFYTSGTTGAPKGAMLSHRALVGPLRGMSVVPELPLGEAVAALPVAHIMGFVTYLGLAVSGVPVVSFERFRPVEVLDAIEEHHASVFVGVPAMYRMLLEAGAADRDLSSIRLWISGADVMPSDLARRFQQLGATVTLPVVGPIGDAAFVEGYGMVEVGGAVAVKAAVPGVPMGGDSLGFRIPGYRFRVVGDDGATVRHGAVGELVLKGPGVLAGYWEAPEATAAVLDADGWLHTGDLVRRGPLGTIVFQGRSKNVIKSGGYSVYPREIESVLEEHPDVLEAAVVGVDDDHLGQVPAAAVRVRRGAKVSGPKLVAWAGDRLSAYKAPRRVVVVTDLPRTGTEKVQADRVRQLFA